MATADDPDLAIDQALARLRAAVASNRPAALPDVALLLAELDRVRAESAERWDAIGRLAPAAKAQRGKARDLDRLLDELRAGLAAGTPPADLLTQLDAGRVR
jgi:hypothetical protein